MTLAAGSRLGPYEVVAPLGAGGMGEVFRGRDTRLGRDVAIKILPAGFAQNEQFRARFEREAKTISSLNHPNICTLFDVGQENGAHYLVMELIEGESLADRIQKGPLPLDQVLRYGAQVADALERAHKQGIVHRDLKPGNVMITKSGAKLLDFGLARPATESAVVHGMTEMPTQAKPLTQEGTLLGTFQYMAPEQLEGAEADARTDIFALGALLYEMATGRRAFEGSNRTSLIAAIVSSHPAPISSVAPMSPPALDHIVKKCLEKDPDDRWQSAHDIAGELRWLSEAGSQAGVATTITVRRRTRERLAWGVAAILAIALLASIAPHLRSRRPVMARLSVTAPSGVTISQRAGNVAISPDGSSIVFVASDGDGRSGLWVRSLGDLVPRFLAGTTDALYPFWSPDSGYVAFFAGGKLKRVSVAAGDVDVICPASDGRGGSWSPAGVIVFSPSVSSALMRVDASGGEPTELTKLDPSKREVSHRFPCFLPDGERFLFFVPDEASSGKGTVYAGSVSGPKRIEVMRTERMPVYAEPGYLVFASGDRVVARRFDSDALRLTGEPIRLPDGVPTVVNSGDRVASASSNGTLLIAAPAVTTTKLVWFDRRGEVAGSVPLPNGTFIDPRISPDGTRVVTAMVTGEATADLWMVDLARGAPTRLTFGPAVNRRPVWSPDGKRIVYQSDRSGVFDLFVRQAGGSGGDTLLFASPMAWKEPLSWSPDGKILTFVGVAKESGFDIHLLSTEGKPKESVFLRTPAREWGATISPDGRWLAYESNESGRSEVYVQSFPVAGTKYQVSTTGGSVPRWRATGGELFFVSSDRVLTAVPVSGSDGLEFGPPQPLFNVADEADFDISADGQRILAVVPTNSAASQSLTVVLNWNEGLRK